MKGFGASIAFTVGVQSTVHSFTVPFTMLMRHPALEARSLALPAATSEFDWALIFDCDGVIIETEELHRLAYNAAFQAAELTIDGEPVEWSVEYYDILQNTVGGGKPKMFHHFRNTKGKFPMVGDKPAPATPDEEKALVDALQAHKTDLYKDLIAKKAVPRPGVIELMDQALADPTIAVGVCSASTKAAVTKVLDVTLGKGRREKLNVCILGDDVSKLKPDPMIYNTAADTLNIDQSKCVVIEDSMVGLRAAKRAVGKKAQHFWQCEEILVLFVHGIFMRSVLLYARRA